MTNNETLAIPPPAIAKALASVDEWSYNIFELDELTSGKPTKYLIKHLFDRYGFIQKYNISLPVLEKFLDRVEEGHSIFNNPYHNSLHAADVTQTVHYMLTQASPKSWTTDLENFACLFAAAIHDYEHTGKSNSFHVQIESERALLYNDRSVNENHHASAAFRLLKEDGCNILANFSKADYVKFRNLVINMVLATDLFFHSQLLDEIEKDLKLPEPKAEKMKALAFMLHCCDIANPVKLWPQAQRSAKLITEEFFAQGEVERELGFPLSMFCDRNTTTVPDTQLKFIDHYVEPSFVTLTDMLQLLLDETESEDKSPNKQRQFIKTPWKMCITENKASWKDEARTSIKVTFQDPIATTSTTN